MKTKRTGQIWASWAVWASWLIAGCFICRQTKTRQIHRNSLHIAPQLCNCTCFAASLTPATETMLCVSITLPVLLYFNSWKSHFIINKPSFHTRVCRPCCPVLVRRNRINRSFMNQVFHSVWQQSCYGTYLEPFCHNPYILLWFHCFSLVENEDSCLHETKEAPVS